MKSNYLNNLEREFYFVTDEEREQIINEYQVHFEERIKDGATEAEVISNLGTPKSVAIEYATELDINYSTVEKQLSNIKRDSNLYFKALKKKVNEIKSEETAKRKNKHSYVKDGKDVVSDTSAINNSNHPSTPSSNLIIRFFRKIIALFAVFLYALKTFIYLVCKYTFRFFIFIIGVWFAIVVLSGLALALILPIFITFTNFGFALWLLIYGTIASAIVFFATISVICLKRFGSTTNE